MGWKLYRGPLMNSWEYVSAEKEPELIAVIDHIEGSDYLLCHAINMKNCGHYRLLADAKKAALVGGLSTAKVAPINAKDGYSQDFINSTM